MWFIVYSLDIGKVIVLKKWLERLLALTIGSLFALGIAEIVTRYALPISPGVYKLSIDGDRLDLDDLTPSLHFRQVSSEFDVETTISKDGYRVPETTNPDTVFIGDSFTYGVGLSDEDTFIMQYCTQQKISCMNLGVPGYGTINAIERLETFIQDKNIKPRRVILVMLAMTEFLGAGNDLYDNIKITESRNAPKNNNGSPIEYKETTLRRFSNIVLKYSNFARVIKFYFAPMIKSVLVIKPEQNQLEKALSITKTQLEKLHLLSQTHQFSLNIILIHPIQDISRGSHEETLKAIQAISPVKITASASFFEANPNNFYFPSDGHFNKAGSDKIVELLNNLKQK